MADTTTTTKASRWRATIVATGAAVGLSLAGLGIAAAQTDGSTPANPPAEQGPPGADGAARGQGPGGGKGGPGGGHRGGPGKGMGMGIHGEFVTRAPAGGYQTMAHQVGEVTEVSATALTVKSEDGFTRTYVVNDDTMVNAGNDGIADVKQGDQVRVTAVVRDGKAFAVDVHDQTQANALREKWAPARPEKPAPAPAAGAGNKGTPSS